MSPQLMKRMDALVLSRLITVEAMDDCFSAFHFDKSGRLGLSTCSDVGVEARSAARSSTWAGREPWQGLAQS